MNEPHRDIDCFPLTPDRWEDLVLLFGPRGAYGGCWCMYWRLKRSEWSRQCGEENKRALQMLVDTGNVPGIIAYVDGKPIGWCSVARREQFGSLERSRKYKRIDDKPVWSIVCFYVERAFRRTGVTVDLIRAACEYVRSQGGDIVEGYPIHPKGNLHDVSAYMGTKTAFVRAGFVEAARIDDKHTVMRMHLNG